MTDRNINKVVLHCSATQDCEENTDRFDMIGADDIKKWHTMPPPAGNGWDDIGYHYIIRRSGVIEAGRKIETVGAHTRGHNDDSIGICYVGTNHPTDLQVSSILGLYQAIYFDYKINHMCWLGHYELDKNKTCPGINMTILRLLLSHYTPREN